MKSSLLRRIILTAALITLFVGVGGLGVVWAEPFAYVTNHDSNNVSVIDTATNTVVDTIPGFTFPRGVTVTPDGAFTYVVNEWAYSVSVIDNSINAIVKTVGVGSRPRLIAITPDGVFAYVTNFSSSTVSVIDTATNTVVDTISVGLNPHGIAITPDGALAYVCNYNQKSLSVIDIAFNVVMDTVALDYFPQSLAITPDGAFVYVTHGRDDKVSVVATVDNTVKHTVDVSRANEIAFTPDGAFAYTSGYLSNTVSVIETASNTVVATVPMDLRPHYIAITPDGAFAYVTHNITPSGIVSVMETASNTVVATVPVGAAATGIAITPSVVPPPTVSISSVSAPQDGYYPFESFSEFPAIIYTQPVSFHVVTSDSQKVEVNGVSATGGPSDWTASGVILDVGVSTITATATAEGGIGQHSVEVTFDPDYDDDGIQNDVDPVPRAPSNEFSDQAATGLGQGPISIDITPDGSRAYVTNLYSNSVSVIDMATFEVLANIPVQVHPRGIAITPDGSRAYVVNTGSVSVSVIDTFSNTEEETIGVGVDQFLPGVAISPDGTRAYVTLYEWAGQISVINTLSNTLVTNVAAGQYSYDVAFTPDGSYAFVTNYNLSTDVIVIDTFLNLSVATINVGSASAIAISSNISSPDGDPANDYYPAYVTLHRDQKVREINTKNHTYTGREVLVGNIPYDLAITPDGEHIYVINRLDDTVSLINTLNLTVVGLPIPVGSRPYGIAISPDGSRALVVNHNSNSVSVIDTSDNSVTTPVVAGSGGTSFGSIDDVGEQILTVSDLPDATYPNGGGVLVKAAQSGGLTPGKVQPCGLEFMGNPWYMYFRAGDEQEIYCGSLKVKVYIGYGEIVFVTPDGVEGTVIVSEGDGVEFETPIYEFDPATVTVSAPETNSEPVIINIEGQEMSLSPGEQAAHSDGDGIPDEEDTCPASDLSLTVVIDGCDSGVENQLLEDGCTISDRVMACADGASNHGKFVSCVAKMTNALKKAGIISGQEKGAIQSCAAQANIP